MTPLAQLLTNLTLDKKITPTAAVSRDWFPTLQSSDCHCFEVTDVQGLADQLIANHNWQIGADHRLFLPSPRTWIEWRNDGSYEGDPGRFGALLEEAQNDRGERRITVNQCVFMAGEISTYTHGIAIIKDDNGPARIVAPLDFSDDERDHVATVMRTYCAFLSLINTPRIIGRRTHLPHAGLQRKLARSRGMVGKFPLHAWTEIKLEVATIHDAGERISHLSGGKALHFCRAHLRIRLGQVEIVSSHWRGDPSLGIKRTRYSVVPPRWRGNDNGRADGQATSTFGR
jgi:hypothetical protein